ncbi:MAG TPA: DUF3108 domain-containing protein [Noviherbaspirillum sp.]|nr:DUF3108 domain-containing protein [Noviherbaspirillum sp.]
MTVFISRLVTYAVLTSSLWFATMLPDAQAAVNAAVKRKVNLPPSAELAYVIKARQKGIPVNGEAIMRWTASGKRFTATNEARAMLVGKILDARSEGSVDAYGLAPDSFTEKRFRKEATITTFDRSGKMIRFSGSDHTYPINGGEQERNSALWQLISVARAAPGRFKPGTVWRFFVAGQRDAEPWAFKVMRQEKIETQLGEMTTLHISKAPPPDSQEQQLDIWLAPSLEWYPARLRFSDSNGDFVEQTLQQVNRLHP